MNDAYGDPRNYDPNDQDPFDWNNFDSTWGAPPQVAPSIAPPAPQAQPPSVTWGQMNPPQNVPGGWQDEHTGGFVPANGNNKAGYMDLSSWAARGVPADQIVDFTTGQLRPGWSRTANGYERTGGGTADTQYPKFDPIPITYGGDGGGGSMSMPNEGFQWPTYNAPRFSYGEFPGFKPFKQPSMDEILADPVLQAQLTEGQRRIKGDRAFRGVLNTGDTLKDIFDWTSDRVKLGANDAFDRAFKVYDINERQNPFNTWSANKGLALDTFNANAPQARDEFFYNQYEPARNQFQQNYDIWKSQGDWLSNLSRPID